MRRRKKTGDRPLKERKWTVKTDEYKRRLEEETKFFLSENAASGSISTAS